MPQAGEGTYSMPAGFVRPRLSLLDVFVLLWRAKWLMIAVFVPVLAAGIAGAVLLPTTYTATARLIVSPERGALVAPELELLRSPVVAQRALSRVTLARAYPEIANSCRPDACVRLGSAAVSGSIAVSAAPDNPVITAQFRHRQASMSAEMLNAIAEAYLAYREEVFADDRDAGIRDQQARLEKNLSEAEQAIRDYLVGNDLTNLAAERETLQQLYRTASAELLQTQSRLRQAQAQLAGYEAQIKTIEPQLSLNVEDAAEQALAALKREREEKLSRYLPDSRVIQDLNRRIRQEEDQLASRAKPGAVLRGGPNPVFQQIGASIVALQSDIRALRGQEADLSSQIAGFEARQRQLVELVPGLQQLERQREASEAAVRAYLGQAAQERARTELMRQGGEAVRVLEAAMRPVDGASLKIPAVLLALALASLLALAAGLTRVYTRRGLATPGAAERTLGLPVVASIRSY